MSDHLGAVDLRSPIESLPGVGSRRGAEFRRIGIATAGALLRHYPTRYEVEEAESSIADLAFEATVSARGEVTATRVVPRGKQRFEAVLSDGTGRLDLVWFHAAYLRDRIKPGMRLRVQGKSKRFGPGVQLVNPRWEEIRPDRDAPATADRRLRPVYPATDELSSREIEAAVAAAMPTLLPMIEDHLPEAFRRERELPSLADALRMAHAPADDREASGGRRRLAYDELLLMQLAVAMKRAHQRRTQHAPALRWTPEIDAAIRRRIPFTLTPGQEAAVREIVPDLGSTAPANRLIQGDVGSGKTAVALYAMLLAAAGRKQAALMAPTEILAEQHYASLSRMLEGSSVRLGLLTGSMPDAERASVVAEAESGAIDIVVGTHALLTERVRFASLAVAVIDEQHRFGVHQRAALREKADDPGSAPHTLVMTATPIPRTLSLTVFGDLDVTTIRGLPPGRMPVTTRVVGTDRAAEVYAYVRKRLDAGEQAYIVVPAIDTGESAGGGPPDLRSVMRRLEEGELRGKRLAALHGRLGRDTRESVMERFRLGMIDALLATTVIEVGVDVPNASVMVVEHADRFGLSQLHQLRGRVGRGSRRSLCVLIGDPATPDGIARLKAMAEITDGFVLAEKDLELRGPGEVLGSRQSGEAPFMAAEFPRDIELLLMARRDAQAWIARSPALNEPDERVLRARLLRAHGEEIALADIA